ncbi:hypothetical protein TRAPUB_14018 [Trametes pubescens]|uniref:Uncharacterized protein n=1 Tax=Trametes pubescens TaxID=154538 RepID=A0A1M2VPJ3_TRAPU|nr:hypothetical protein TRAPUB_14018 [Trametes pubescens]
MERVQGTLRGAVSEHKSVFWTTFTEGSMLLAWQEEAAGDIPFRSFRAAGGKVRRWLCVPDLAIGTTRLLVGE